ncbi:MAG: hypothetical protein ABFS18_06205 [Thermodesulfobacteriota bacterium]
MNLNVMFMKYIYCIAAIVVGLLAIGNIRLEPPSELRGTLITEGKINECDFRKFRKRMRFFVGITLDNQSSPYLRTDPLHKEKKRFKALCESKPQVRISYHAVKRLRGSISFWIDEIVEIEPKHNPLIKADEI